MDDDTPLSAEDVLTFGPVVEAAVWTPMWLQETRAPIAVAAGRPRLGRVFNDDGVGRAVIIRPCVSRGRRVRGLPPIYTPQMLESNASVFDGWPMFMDHVPPEVAQTLAKRGRSVRDLGGQILKAGWDREYVNEADSEFGYRPGGVVGDVWATPLIRETVGENPNLLHTSINAWPTSGTPGPVPWRPALKGMLIEGIRRQPQGSVDYVVRGGAGGKLLVAEGVEDEGAWPEIGEWDEQDRRLVVSLAERLYATPQMTPTLPSEPGQLREWLSENAAHLLPALDASGATGNGNAEGLTTDDVRRIVSESNAGQPTVEEFQEQLEERTQELLTEREQQRTLSVLAERLIESAEGIPPAWKADLRARYMMLPSGPPATLLVQEGATDADTGESLSPEQVIERRVTNDLQHTRDLILEAQGRPRVKGEGGAKRDPSDDTGTKRSSSASHWRSRFAEMGLAESADDALDIYGEKVEG